MKNPIVFNITFKMGQPEASELIEALKSNILPQCTDGTIITSSQINRILLNDNDDEDETFAVQFVYTTQAIFNEKKLSTMAQFLGMVDEQFQGKYVYFATMMELLHHQKK